ncbi:hypothetical protein B0H14DRAFT_2571430 [Mycena olivaceomarginata]|nr:hypothetical protein B0H14DRAFT_2571430 [Mycena olivaceomarginata]
MVEWAQELIDLIIEHTSTAKQRLLMFRYMDLMIDLDFADNSKLLRWLRSSLCYREFAVWSYIRDGMRMGSSRVQDHASFPSSASHPAMPWAGPIAPEYMTKLRTPWNRLLVIAQSLLYFSRLFSTLFAALLAVLGKQWLLYYNSGDEQGTVEERGLKRPAKAGKKFLTWLSCVTSTNTNLLRSNKSPISPERGQRLQREIFAAKGWTGRSTLLLPSTSTRSRKSESRPEEPKKAPLVKTKRATPKAKPTKVVKVSVKSVKAKAMASTRRAVKIVTDSESEAEHGSDDEHSGNADNSDEGDVEDEEVLTTLMLQQVPSLVRAKVAAVDDEGTDDEGAESDGSREIDDVASQPKVKGISKKDDMGPLGAASWDADNAPDIHAVDYGGSTGWMDG